MLEFCAWWWGQALEQVKRGIRLIACTVMLYNEIFGEHCQRRQQPQSKKTLGFRMNLWELHLQTIVGNT